MARLSVPTTARLPSSLPVETSNNAVVKLLNRLSRPSLLSMVLDWLDPTNLSLCPPLLKDKDDDDDDDENDDFYPPARSVEELRDIYSDMQQRKGSKREVVDRIVEGDWRNGVTLYQLAMADIQYLYDHPGSLKWTAYKIQRLQTPSSEDGAEGPQKLDRESLVIPRFHPSTFVQNLQAEVLPDVKAHYNLDRPEGMPLWLLRIFILDSPYNTGVAVRNRTGERAATSFDASRTVYLAFPDASPHVFLSNAQTTGAAAAGESKSLRQLIVEGIPKAMSRPRERYALRPTSLATKNLAELLRVRGAGRSNAAGGGWSVYAAEDKRIDSPLNPVLPTPPLSDAASSSSSSTEDRAAGGGALLQQQRKRAWTKTTHDKYQQEAKRAKVVAQARFGDSAKVEDTKGVERVDILIEDPFHATGGRHRDAGGEEEEEEGEEEAEGAQDWKPKIRLTFHGNHVFAGIRQLVEAGIVDGERMPGWMTGEEGVTIGAVRHGRIRGHKGSGL